MAGHKGYAMDFMFEILAGVLTGAMFGRDVGSLVPPDLSKPLGIGHLVLVLEVEQFMPYPEFQLRLEQYIDQVKNSEVIYSSRPIKIPGEGSTERKKRNLAECFPFKKTTYLEFVRLSEEYGVTSSFISLKKHFECSTAGRYL